MALPVSDKYLAAQAADANLPVSRVRLVLGNYASSPAYGSTAAATSELSADYPASGAVDGDRTEINIGPASGADNDVGQSSWQSAVAPDTTPQSLTITFTQARTFNRIKLYNRDGHGSKTYFLQWWDGAAWNTFAATSDIVAPGQVSIIPTYKLDVVDFPDVTTTMLRLTVNHTQVAAENAQVVELEVYRLVDITGKVKDISISRARDYKLANPMAAALTLACDNSDRFFSLNHTPTDAETAQGFVNGELDANIGVVVSLGFDYFGAVPETPDVFVGYVDRIQVRPAGRDVTIEARDGMKALINRVDSTKLKTATDLSDDIRYLLNRSNISDYEMSLDTSGIMLDFFFTDNENVLSSIRDIVEATVDAAFFFDESGVATYRFYAGNVPLSKLFTSQEDWESGTFDDTEAQNVPGDLLLDFTNATSRQPQTWAQSTSGWDFTNPVTHPGTWSDNLGTNLELSTGGTITVNGVGKATRALSSGSGRWNFTTKLENGIGSPNHRIWVMFQVQQVVSSFTTFINVGYDGYAIFINDFDNTVSLWKVNDSGGDPGAGVMLASGGIPVLLGGGVHTWTVTKDPGGRMRVFFDGTLKCSATDTDFATGAHYGIFVSEAPGNSQAYFGDGTLYTPADSLSGTWVTPPIDTGANTSAYTNITDTVIPNGGTVTYETRSSPDGITWNAYVATGGGNAILSPVLRYLQVRATLASPSLASNDNPDVLDITVNWVGSATSKKYPPPPSSFTFGFDSTLLDVAQELADNLGGDSSILNDVSVQAQPLVLTGADTDTVWQATVGTPPVNVSAGDPIAVTNGQVLTIAPYISGGMDISKMGGADPPAAVVVFGSGASGTWGFSSVHPTLPVLVITVTGTGTITDLRLVGKVFQSAQYLQVQQETDPLSISKYGDRQTSISNQWVVSASVADQIAKTLLSNFKSPTAYISSCAVRPTFSAQIGDRITVVDDNLDLSADYVSVGVSHKFSASMESGDARTSLVLLKVPVGD